jgi:hypothetical protein
MKRLIIFLQVFKTFQVCCPENRFHHEAGMSDFFCSFFFKFCVSEGLVNPKGLRSRLQSGERADYLPGLPIPIWLSNPFCTAINKELFCLGIETKNQSLLNGSWQKSALDLFPAKKNSHHLNQHFFMKLNSVIFMALCGLLTLNACSKDDDESPTDLLTGGTWSLSEQRTDTDLDGTLENSLEDCSKDDKTTFEDGGSYKFDEGATKCDPSDPQSSTGTWALSTDGKILTITEDGFPLAFTVVSLTNKRMELKIEGFIEAR